MIGDILIKHVELCSFFLVLLAKWRPCIAAEEVWEVASHSSVGVGAFGQL